MNKRYGFHYLKQNFTVAKIDDIILVGPKISLLIPDIKREEVLNDLKFSVNVSRYQTFGGDMGLKIHFLNLATGLSNLGDVSDEYGERFHQNISTIQKCYQGNWKSQMLAYYWWELVSKTYLPLR